MDPLLLNPACARPVEQIGEEFLASIYAAEMVRRPDNVSALAELGHVYTRLGRYKDGLAVDVKLVGFAPEDPTVRYNLGCSQALVGQVDEALSTLELAVELGYEDGPFMGDDEDLVPLRAHPRFVALLARLEGEGSAT